MNKPRSTEELTLLMGLLHDVRNALAVIEPAASHVRRIVSGSHAEALDDAVRAAERARGLLIHVADVLNGARQHETAQVDLAALVPELARSLARVVGTTTELTVESTVRSAVIRGADAHVWRVLWNVCLNACESLEGCLRRSVHISLNRDASHVYIEIRDTGRGMDEETQRRLGEARFTTKADAAGHGFGLASSWLMVMEMGGRVVVRSKPGSGTHVRISFAAG